MVTRKEVEDLGGSHNSGGMVGLVHDVDSVDFEALKHFKRLQDLVPRSKKDRRWETRVGVQVRGALLRSQISIEPGGILTCRTSDRTTLRFKVFFLRKSCTESKRRT